MPNRRAITLIRMLIVIAAAVVVLGVGIPTLVFLLSPSSEGQRVGFLQKFSHRRGYVGSSYEGELVQAGFGGTHVGKSGQAAGRYGDVWAFSVLNGEAEVAKAAAALVGREVVVTYEEVSYPASWKSATGYRVTRVEPADHEDRAVHTAPVGLDR